MAGVTCEECGRSYDDAKRWTLCPHPELDSWDAGRLISEVRHAKETSQAGNVDSVDALMDAPGWERMWALCRSGAKEFVVLTMDMPVGVQILSKGNTAVEACRNAIEARKEGDKDRICNTPCR